jgi:hypothetical protein
MATVVHSIELEGLMDRAQVNPAQRLELRSDPELAIELLTYALGRARIRNPAAFAVARFRRRRMEEHREIAEAVEDELLGVEELQDALAFAKRYGVPAEHVERIEADLAAAIERARDVA